jgi:hypothetical protein
MTFPARSAAPSPTVVAVMFLTTPPRLNLTIDRGAYTKAAIRIFFTAECGERRCIDSRVMCRTAAIRNARKIAETGAQVEVARFAFGGVRPHPAEVRKVRRLDEVRLNRVASLISATSMFTDSIVTMEKDDADET